MSKWDLQLFLGLPTKQDWPQLLIECFAEIFGTFIIVFFGCGSVLSPAVQVSFHFSTIFHVHKKTKKIFQRTMISTRTSWILCKSAWLLDSQFLLEFI